jgi:hypothetical protein
MAIGEYLEYEIRDMNSSKKKKKRKKKEKTHAIPIEASWQTGPVALCAILIS